MTVMRYFDESAGALVVTSRVDVAVDYVFTPNKEGTIELTAPASSSFTYGDAGLLSKDRITIIDCGGTCGVSSPTKSISMPLMADSIETWNDFPAASYFFDPAHVDLENPIDPLKMVEIASAAEAMRYTTEGYEGKYVPMANLAPTAARGSTATVTGTSPAWTRPARTRSARARTSACTSATASARRASRSTCTPRSRAASSTRGPPRASTTG